MTTETFELADAAFNFWFNNNQHIRSPFPQEIHAELRVTTEEKFNAWSESLDLNAEKEVNDEVMAEKFEEILFELGLELVESEDDKLTILYPFLPRIGDQISSHDHGPSTIISRDITKQEELSFMKVELNAEDGTVWSTEFQLPV